MSAQTYGTEKKGDDDLFDCIVSLLKSQAEYEKKEQARQAKEFQLITT